MKKKILTLLTACIVTALLAPSAFAWKSVRTGQKNFERAWSAYVYKRPDDAKAYYAKAADAFAEALAEIPPSRTTMFASNLAMAGISLYNAGRYQSAIDALGKAIPGDSRLWEAYLYTALSYAQLGDKAKTIDFLTQYIKSSPGQPILSTEVQRQLTDLETDSAPLANIIAPIEQAIFNQINNNINLNASSGDTPTNRCDGNYWWRYNRSPCSSRNFKTM